MAIYGIDVSEWQNNIEKVEFGFAIVRTTHGKSYTDPFGQRHIAAAKGEGKLYGFYHFLSNHGIDEQVKHFVKTNRHRFGEGIAVVDYEDLSGNETAVTTHGVKGLERFISEVKRYTGVECVVYLNESTFNGLPTEVKKKYKFWVASWGSNPVGGYGVSKKKFSYPVVLHQFTSRGRLNGYKGDLDLDIFYGSKADWLEIARVKGPSAFIASAQHVLKVVYPLYAGKLVVDGINGPKTKAALEEFQRRSGIPVTGKVDAKTAYKLNI